MKVCLKCKETFVSKNWVCPRCGSFPRKKNGYLSFLSEAVCAEQGFDSGYYPQLASLEEKNFWFRFRNKLLLWAIRRHFPGSERFLEIGSGTGFVLSGLHNDFPEMKIIGSDIYPQGLDYARQRVPDATFLHMDACNIPFEDEFDLIGMFDILEHIQDDQKVLNQVGKAVHENGGIILTVPQYKWIWSAQDNAAFHVRRYSRKELRSKVEAAGFTIVYMTSFITLLFPLLVFSRLAANYIERSDVPHDWTRELRLHPFINAAFETLCNLELLFLKKSVRMPVGSSLLCIGVKE